MSMNSFYVARLLEKMSSADKDFRFMATSDLMSELEKDSIKLDDDNERRVVHAVLSLLDDKNSEVQNLAVRSMGRLVNKVKDSRAEQIVKSLCVGIKSEDYQHRDVHCVGLRNVITHLPSNSGPSVMNVCRLACPNLIDILRDENTMFEMQMECLDMLNIILTRFGTRLPEFHELVKETVLSLMRNSRMAIRKRAVQVLCVLVNVSSKTVLESVGILLVELLKDRSSLTTLRTYINCVGALSVAAGPRFAPYLTQVLPTIVHYCRIVEDDEIREACLQCFENVLFRCSAECTPCISGIVDLSLTYLTYDPNYHYSDDQDHRDDGDSSEMDVDYGSSEEEQEFSDDDDVSWKVRRAAAKCIGAAITARRELLVRFCIDVAPLLIERLKEREEVVKDDIFATLIILLKQCSFASTCATDAGDHGCNEVLSTLQSLVPQMVRAVSKLLREKSPKTKKNCFALLTELVRVLPGVLATHFHQLVPGLCGALEDRMSSSELKMDALQFLCDTIESHPLCVFDQYVGVLAEMLMQAVNDAFYKVSALSLAVLQVLMRSLRPYNDVTDLNWTAYTPVITKVYAFVLVKLNATDVDQEIKERAITCAGVLLACFSDYLKDDLDPCLIILLERTKNEVTRLIAVRTLISILESPVQISMDSILADLMGCLSTYLKKNVRVLRAKTLHLLHLLIIRHKSSLDSALLSDVLAKVPSLIGKNDLELSEQALLLVIDVLEIAPGVAVRNCEHILAPVISLLSVPLLYDVSLETVFTFFFTLCRALTKQSASSGFDQLKYTLVKSLTGIEESSQAKYTCQNTARCFSAVVSAEPSKAFEVLEELLRNLDDRNNLSLRMFSLLAIGEIIRVLPTLLNVINVETVFEQWFRDSEEIRTAASHALGRMATADLSFFLPYILTRIATQPKQQYLFLQSLLEIVSSSKTCSSTSTFLDMVKPHCDQIWTVLVAHADSSEEGVRNLVAECLGKICVLDPYVFLPRLAELLNCSINPLGRSTITVAVKFSILNLPPQFDNVFKSYVKQLFVTLNDVDLGVRRIALQTLNSALHNKTALMKDFVNNFAPAVYAETAVRQNLIREIEMGPFKQTVDDGLDLRNAAFACMNTLLSKCFDRLDTDEFIKYLENGLKDHHDVQILSYLMLIKVAALRPANILRRLENLVEPIKNACTSKVKANAVKQEYEKHDELRRYALKAFGALLVRGDFSVQLQIFHSVELQNIPDADKHPSVCEVIGIIKGSHELSNLYKSARQDLIAEADDEKDQETRMEV
ncbi:cullin associated NEDD8 dissociated protein [Trichuris trichiura]|uniref:Cullin associated NEDD8 dissociated protein n=1 Tax=Trichuris trichiura TaxID=36087 RepID=A0A077Z6L7_TRITR|nr:cullin associated NEDD8 dissociated protein [Trichuris trichiura]